MGQLQTSHRMLVEDLQVRNKRKKTSGRKVGLFGPRNSVFTFLGAVLQEVGISTQFVEQETMPTCQLPRHGSLVKYVVCSQGEHGRTTTAKRLLNRVNFFRGKG